jgi:hypothetical protein
MNSESPVSKMFGGKRYVFSENHDHKTIAKERAKHWREHGVPARVWQNPETKQYIVYIKAGSHYKKTSERKLKRDWGVRKS